jgi:hypothetical protein
MKTLTIGDIHGRRDWKKFLFGNEDLYREWRRNSDINRVETLKSIIPMYDYDKIIFVGDYVDSFTVGNLDMKENLQDIIHLARFERDKIVLLLGNHDVQYFIPKSGGCSGFRPEMQWDFHELFQRDRELFHLAFQYKDWLWSHAGVNERFFSDHMENRPRHVKEDWAYMLNDMLNREEHQVFQVSYFRGGASLYAGPLWTDRKELVHQPMPGINQIVGHTPVPDIDEVDTPNAKLIFVDCLERGSNRPFEKIFDY